MKPLNTLKIKDKIYSIGSAFTGLFVLLFLIMANQPLAHANPLSGEANYNSHLEIAASDTDEVHTVVDEMPEIIGGLSELYKNIRYPASAQSAGIEGRVFLQFIVDKEGYPQDPQILRDIGGGCGDAAVAALKRVRFTPGILNGEPVNVQFSLPVTFRLEE